jgi:hypothetical protein
MFQTSETMGCDKSPSCQHSLAAFLQLSQDDHKDNKGVQLSFLICPEHCGTCNSYHSSGTPLSPKEMNKDNSRIIVQR